jgi:periplasmic divalent cation tolerance protein
MKHSSASVGTAVVFVTAASEQQAEAIANALVTERLAACVNVVSPIRSIYRWEGKVQSDLEHLMIIKTRVKLVAKVEERVKQLHSYEVPEIIALPIVAGARSYLDWILASTAAPPRAGVESGRATAGARRKK